MNKRFTVELCSDLDFEGMVIDISYDTTPIASISYDKGIDEMEVELIPFGKEVKDLRLPLRDFMLALEKAKKLALECAEADSQRSEES